MLASRPTPTPNYYPGTRVRVFDSRLYRGDVKTPLSITMQTGVVMAWYGRTANTKAGGSQFGPYPSLIDVKFDRDGYVSRCHFAEPTYVQILGETNNQ